MSMNVWMCVFACLLVEIQREKEESVAENEQSRRLDRVRNMIEAKAALRMHYHFFFFFLSFSLSLSLSLQKEKKQNPSTFYTYIYAQTHTHTQTYTDTIIWFGERPRFFLSFFPSPPFPPPQKKYTLRQPSDPIRSDPITITYLRPTLLLSAFQRRSKSEPGER